MPLPIEETTPPVTKIYRTVFSGVSAAETAVEEMEPIVRSFREGDGRLRRVRGFRKAGSRPPTKRGTGTALRESIPYPQACVKRILAWSGGMAVGVGVVLRGRRSYADGVLRGRRSYADGGPTRTAVLRGRRQRPVASNSLRRIPCALSFLHCDRLRRFGSSIVAFSGRFATGERDDRRPTATLRVRYPIASTAPQAARCNGTLPPSA